MRKLSQLLQAPSARSSVMAAVMVAVEGRYSGQRHLVPWEKWGGGREERLCQAAVVMGVSTVLPTTARTPYILPAAFCRCRLQHGKGAASLDSPEAGSLVSRAHAPIALPPDVLLPVPTVPVPMSATMPQQLEHGEPKLW